VLFQGYSQKIPSVTSNSTFDDKESSIVYNRFNVEFDSFLSYHKYCYWSNKDTYLVFGYKDEEWKALKLTVKYAEEVPRKKTILRIKQNKIRVSEKELTKLIEYFTTNNFWTLENDSLNLHERRELDGTITLYTATDGCSDNFETLSSGNFRLTSSYNAEYFQKLIPVNQREKFILCRDEMLRLLGK